MPNKTDWLLLALAEASGGSLSPVQIQKALFIFRQGASRNLPDNNFYEFVPYNYGPFDSLIYADLERLEIKGFVNILNPSAGSQRRYVVTKSGTERASSLRSIDARHAKFLKEVVEWVQRQSFSELVRAIYQKWPSYRKNSVFVDSV